MEKEIVKTIVDVQRQNRKAILGGFGSISVEKSNEDELEKAHVKEYQRKTKSGKLSTVKQHEDKRKNHLDYNETKARRFARERGLDPNHKDTIDEYKKTEEHYQDRKNRKEGNFGSSFKNKASTLTVNDVEKIIHNEKYFKGENHSRAKMVLMDFAKNKEKSNHGEQLYDEEMDRKEKKYIHSAVDRYLEDKESKRKLKKNNIKRNDK